MGCAGRTRTGVATVRIDAQQAHQSLKAMKPEKRPIRMTQSDLHGWGGPASTRCMSNRRMRMACARQHVRRLGSSPPGPPARSSPSHTDALNHESEVEEHGG